MSDAAVKTDEIPSETTASLRRDPVVDGFYGHVIRVLEDSPDGASAATQITAEFQRHHVAARHALDAMVLDVRRIAGDDRAKAAMLTHAAQHSKRMLDEHLRLVGQLHAHREVESKLLELAGEVELTAPAVAEQVRELLAGITPVVPVATGTVVVASQTDHRWTTGWFATDAGGPLEPLPFVGWVLTAEAAGAPAQGVESAFTMNGTWYTKGELAQRGYILRRLD